MLFTKLKITIAVLLVLGIAALGAGGLIPRSLAIEPGGGMPAVQEQGQTNRDDVNERVAELKQLLGHLQKKLAKLELETKTKGNTTDTAFLADRFKYRVPFETGSTESKEGGRIEIREVWGTRPRIEVGGQYLVRGNYVLPPGERGLLYFYATAGGRVGPDDAPRPAIHCGGQAGRRICPRSRNGRARVLPSVPRIRRALFPVVRQRVFRHRRQCLPKKAVNGQFSRAMSLALVRKTSSKCVYAQL